MEDEGVIDLDQEGEYVEVQNYSIIIAYGKWQNQHSTLCCKKCMNERDVVGVQSMISTVGQVVHTLATGAIIVCT